MTEDRFLANSGFRHPGTYPEKPGGYFCVHPPKKPTPKNPHFYFNLILVYTLYATNNAIFYCFKAFKALSSLSFCIILPIFSCLSKKPNKTPKCNKTHWVGLFLKNPGFFEPCAN